MMHAWRNPWSKRTPRKSIEGIHWRACFPLLNYVIKTAHSDELAQMGLQPAHWLRLTANLSPVSDDNKACFEEMYPEQGNGS
jgi:hypothetical protein